MIDLNLFLLVIPFAWAAHLAHWSFALTFSCMFCLDKRLVDRSYTPFSMFLVNYSSREVV
jgi:hypothetical protein